MPNPVLVDGDLLKSLVQASEKSQLIARDLKALAPHLFKPAIVPHTWRTTAGDAYAVAIAATGSVRSMLSTRTTGDCKGAFWLSPDHNWALERDSEGVLCLVPREKDRT